MAKFFLKKKLPTKNDEITTSNNMGIKKTHSKYHEGHTIWIGKIFFLGKMEHQR
jgi:hypothetical protein